MQYLFKACCGRQPGTPEEMKLTIGQLNHYLDQLAGDVGNDGKVNVLTQLLQVTTPNQMKWIIQILLKDLKASHCYAQRLTSAPVRQAGDEAGVSTKRRAFSDLRVSDIEEHEFQVPRYCALQRTSFIVTRSGHVAMRESVFVQIGLSETSVLKDYHKDALDRYNVTCDFPKVIRELVNPHKRFPFQASH